MIHEKPDSRTHSIDPKNPRAEIKLIAFWYDDDAEVRDEIAGWIIANGADPYPNTILRLLGIDPTSIAGGVWDITLRYGLPEGVDFPATTFGTSPSSPPPPPPPPTPGLNEVLGPGFNFSTLGGTERRKTSFDTPFKVWTEPGDVPDYLGSIQVKDDGEVEGVDVVAPKLEWTVVVQPKGGITFDYILTLEEMSGTVNDDTFFHHESGECLFLGADGSYRDNEGWTITYHFATSRNKEPLLIEAAGITVDLKRGWDFLWVRFKKIESGTPPRTVTVPYAAYVEQVYEYTDFSRLLIGGA